MGKQIENVTNWCICVFFCKMKTDLILTAHPKSFMLYQQKLYEAI